MIQFQNVSFSYDDEAIYSIQEVSFEVSRGETVVLLGSSGSGKTTILKMINALLKPSSGKIIFNDRDINSYPCHDLRRSIGYVWQGSSLFPHMTVEENVSIVLKLLGRSVKERKARASQLLSTMDLDPEVFSSRYPNQLSGGQEQRVGVARALAADPLCLLMDEPFAALDTITRSSLQDELIRLKSMLDKTIVFVTHDWQEAVKIGDRIAVVHDGQFQQIGTMDELINRPQTPFVAKLIESSLNQYA